MTTSTWLLCGIPRSGSSMCCRIAGEAPDVVALSEPVDPSTFHGVTTSAEACRRIRDFAVRARERILAEGRAASMQVDGRLDDNRVSLAPASGRLRTPRGGLGEVRFDKPSRRDFTLVMKQNAIFATLLPEVAEHFPFLALVRNPLAVLASWQTVDLAVQRGRAPAAEQFDGRLRLALEAEADTLRRQVLLLDWFFERFRNHLPGDRVLRYEDVVASGGLSLFRRLGTASPRRELLASRNANPLYEGASVDALLGALLRVEGAWSDWYSAWELERAADDIGGGAPGPTLPAPRAAAPNRPTSPRRPPARPPRQ